jgi:hypothetical protein
VSNSPHRSFARIIPSDLARLAQIALDDFADLCQRQEYSRRYADRLRLICLCQGAARHYVHGDRGVWDFDLWGFFEEVCAVIPFHTGDAANTISDHRNLVVTLTMMPSRGVR